MDLLKIVVLSLGSIIELFILSKIMGNKEMSQLSSFDYVISITIGSIAAEMATSLEDDFMQPAVAMLIYALVSFIVTIITSKSIVARRFINGASYILYDNGTLYKNNFKKARLDLNDFLIQCRNSGFFSLSDLQTAILEPTGKISFLPSSDKRPANPSDFNIKPYKQNVETNVIIDGKILEKNLYATGNNIAWLDKQLKDQKLNYSDIFLATCTEKNNLNIYKKIERENTHDRFL